MSSIAIKRILLFLMLLLLCQVGNSYSDEQTPEQFVQDFYQWYIKIGKKIDIERNEEIYKYISYDFKKSFFFLNCRRDIDYFVKVCRASAIWDGPEIKIQNRVDMKKHTMLVVELKSTQRKYTETQNVIVFLKKYNDGFRIVEVSDIYPEPYADK